MIGKSNNYNNCKYKFPTMLSVKNNAYPRIYTTKIYN